MKTPKLAAGLVRPSTLGPGTAAQSIPLKNPLLAAASSRQSQRGLGQRLAFGAALASYACAVLALAILFLKLGDLGSQHPVIASLGASLVFFVGAGIVLHVIGRANLPRLGFHREG